jgi:hypothetical protein
MDENGYPAEEELQKIKNWKIETDNDFVDLMHYVELLWSYTYPYFDEEKGMKFSLSTGGWSGNEDIIRALEENMFFWMFYWQSSERGGHYVFCPLNYLFRKE